MIDNKSTLDTIYDNWEAYQKQIAGVLVPLTPEQLDMRAALHLRSIGEIAAHMIGARARWFNGLMGEGDATIAAMSTWDRRTLPGTGAELAQGLDLTWRLIRSCLARWTPEDMAYIFDGEDEEGAYSFSRQWIVWHLIEHDVHHGGEISLTLGMHGLAAPDL